MQENPFFKLRKYIAFLALKDYTKIVIVYKDVRFVAFLLFRDSGGKETQNKPLGNNKGGTL